VRYAGHDLHDSADGLTEPALLSALWSGAIVQLRAAGDCSVLDLPTLAQADAEALRDLGIAHRGYDVDPGARIILPPTSAEYLAMLTVSRRKRMRWERRALERDHGPIGFELIDCRVDITSALDDLWALREDAWQQRRRYSQLAEHVRGDAIRGFLERLAAACRPGRSVALGRLTAGSTLVATALLLSAHRRSWYAMCAFRPAFGRYGPGRLLLAECVHAAILRGFGVLELGRGVEPYKFALGATRYELPNVVVSLRR
jgi:CelD/BcsL family acetyltransferase involved in cellulose biosynthesis